MATGRIPTTANSPLTAKGDLFTFSTGSAKLAVGSNGDTLVADSAATTGLRWASTPSASNPVLNSAMEIWQRGTSVSATAANAYTADRWQLAANTGQTCTVSRQATGDTTNLPFIQYCARVQRNSGQTATGAFAYAQSFENVNSIPFAGKTVTLSFYARAGSNFSPTSSNMLAQLYSGTGTDQNILIGFTGSAVVAQNTAVTLTTTWQRFSISGSIASTATQLGIYFNATPTGTAGANDYFEITGVQLDIGSVALPFRRSGGTLQGELAACQRYFYSVNYLVGTKAAYNVIANGRAVGTTSALVTVTLPVSMRVNPTSLSYGGAVVVDDGSVVASISALTINQAGTNNTLLSASVTGVTANRPVIVYTNNDATAYVHLSAEL
jgi:hypothetical protein